MSDAQYQTLPAAGFDKVMAVKVCVCTCYSCCIN